MARPNLVLITTDQQRWDTLHAAAGNQSILTPHLDWLADTGIAFPRAYADCPVCGPSRATIMTGHHAWSHGETRNTSRTSPMARMPTLPGILTAAGYQTRGVGKMHFSPPRARYGFEHLEILPDYYRWVARQAGAPQPKDHGIGENEMQPVLSTTEERFTATHWTIDRSIDFLETRDPTRPFFLWASFGKPHPPFDPPARYWHLYDGIPLPEPIRGDWSAREDLIPPGFLEPTWSLNDAGHLPPPHLRAAIRAYYACITQIDYNLGLLFARLRELGLLDDTWIVFTSDHGEMLGDHGMGAKSLFLEGSAHIPLLVRPPGGWKPHALSGTRDNRLACLADLLPTFASLAETTPPPGIQGLDLLGGTRRTQLIGHCDSFHAVIRDDGWKYTFTEAGAGELLFDTSRDPHEQVNRLPDPSAAPALTELRSTLTHHLASTGHAACRDGSLVATRPARSRAEVRRAPWPGFHHRSDGDCDLLH